MHRLIFCSFSVILNFSFCSSPQDRATEKKLADSIKVVQMNLSAFGVESDDFPSIEVYIDFVKDSSNCSKSYYNPKFKPSSYRLSSNEIKEILHLLQSSDLEKLKSDYKDSTMSDLPTSTTTIYAGQKKFTVKDYGLKGKYPLQKLYKIVYKL